MKKIILLCIIAIFGLFSFSQTSAKITPEKIEKVYAGFIVKLDRKYSVEKQNTILKDLNKRMYKILDKNISTSKKDIVKELIRNNNNYLFLLFMREHNNSTSQKALELQARIKLTKQTKNTGVPSYVQSLMDVGKELYIVNDTLSFVDKSTIQKIRFSQYFSIDSSTSKQLWKKQWIIVYSIADKKYRFVEKYTFEEVIPYSQLENTFDVFVTKKSNYTLEKGIYYSYIFSHFSFLNDSYGVSLSDLEWLWVSTTNSVLYKNAEGRYNFVKDFIKKKLISADIIDGVVDKARFLEHVRDDKRDLNIDTDTAFRELKKTAESLWKGKDSQEKITLSYDWVLKHTTYTSTIDLEDSEIFSWIDTYKNGDGVCTGYSKLFSYLLMFQWIEDSEVIRGDVIDAPDFPDIGHAWVKIWDQYFDPTFDDPVGTNKDKELTEYKYYNLPRDLLYTNRFDRGDTPEVYKKLSLSKREDIVAKKLYALSEKYSNSSYLLVEPSKFKKKHGFSYDTKITPDILSKVIPLYKVDNNSFSFQKNGKKETIRSLKYFVIDDDNTENVLRQISYKLDGVYFLDWQKTDGSREYRLVYEIGF